MDKEKIELEILERQVKCFSYVIDKGCYYNSDDATIHDLTPAGADVLKAIIESAENRIEYLKSISERYEMEEY